MTRDLVALALFALLLSGCGVDDSGSPAPVHGNHPPVLASVADTTCAFADTLRLQASAVDPDGDILFYGMAVTSGDEVEAHGLRFGIDPTSGALWIRPMSVHRTLPVLVWATDVHGAADSAAFAVRCICGTPEPYDGPTPIGDLYRRCFPRCAECEGARVDALLHLDTVNLPSTNNDSPWLIVRSYPIGQGPGADFLGLRFSGSLPSEIDPGIIAVPGWKLRIRDARLHYCETCLTNCGLEPVLWLEGEVDSLDFIHDPADSVAIYAVRADP